MKKNILASVVAGAVVLGCIGGYAVLADSTNKDTESRPKFEHKGMMEGKGRPMDGMKRGMGLHCNPKLAATVLGITEDEVMSAVKNGTSIGQQLVNAGKLDAYKEAFLAENKARLDQVVADGKLSQADADEKYTAMQEKIQAWDGTGEMIGKPERPVRPEGFEKPVRSDETEKAMSGRGKMNGKRRPVPIKEAAAEEM